MAPAKKTVLITGCSEGGLGHALALELHHRNYRVFATARNATKMHHLASLGIETLVLDVLSSDSIRDCVLTVSSLASGTLDMLINNAGGGYMLPIADAELPECRKLYDLNVWSAVEVTQAFLPLLIKAKGVLAMQSSVGSVVPSPGMGIYVSSKAALSMITDNLRIELSPFDVKVVELKTGSVRTNFHSKKWTLQESSPYRPIKHLMEPFLNSDSEQEKKRMIAPETWARQVVGELVKEKPPAQIWRGGDSLMVWMISTFFWHTFMDRFLLSLSGLDKLRGLRGSRENDGK